MNNRIITAALVAGLALPLAAFAAEKKKNSASFASADADRDGKVTPAEYIVAMKGKLDEGAARAKFAELDKDKDGTLTRDEFDGRSGEKKTRQSKKKGAEAASSDTPRMPRQ